MSNNKSNNKNGTDSATPALPNSMGDYNSSWITDYAWISGVAGAVMVIALAGWYNTFQTLQKGLYVFGHQVTSQRTDSILAALFIITFTMLSIEAFRVWYRDKQNFFSLHPKIKSGQHLSFIFECVLNYVLYLCLIWVVIWFYRNAGEYGFKRNANYYQVWFRFIEWVWYGYLYAGLPYALITRALKYDSTADAKDYGFYFLRLLAYPVEKLVGSIGSKHALGDLDKKITRGLLVKMFFTPLMTVFFIGQFPHLVNNMGYLFGDIWGNAGLWSAVANGDYSNTRLNNDLYNISISFIFSIDVALAWCGYVISSRWVDNQTISAEPTVLGWVVCLLCYPPFQRELGVYFAPPGEKEAIYMFQEQWLITIFLVMMVASYIIYMSATLWFGTRFSNLTHRGIIRKGPFAFVRHPAYASKNFAWWCIMFPAIIYSAFSNHIGPAIFQTIGLVLMTFMYYWRAITEERHLSADPAYLDYCKHVKYRFIPGVI